MFTIRARLFTGLIIITLGGFLYLTYWVVTDIRIPGLRGSEESLFARCNDGTDSDATGSGACSNLDGVDCWCCDED